MYKYTENSYKKLGSMRENASTKDRIFVTPKSRDAKVALEDFGFTPSGFVYDMEVEDLADLLENADIDVDELDVKDENGEIIEDVYSLVFESDDDSDYDNYDDDYADFDFEDDDNDYIDPEFFNI